MECKQIDAPILEHFGLRVLSEENPLSTRLTNLTEQLGSLLASGKLVSLTGTFAELSSLELSLSSCASHAQELEQWHQRWRWLVRMKRVMSKKG
jgi:hypothetical protein